MKNFEWQVLLDWYISHGNHSFPWRQYDHTLGSLLYRVWLAEILLQQTQADRVVPFYEKILEAYPHIENLSTATYEEFFPYYQGLGYYSRARNLLKTAKIITTEYSGVFPRNVTSLKKLPGVGEYTARAILAFGYGESVLAWDTNLETIFARYYNGSKYQKLTSFQKETIEKDLIQFLETIGTNKEQRAIIRDINNALMDWARLMEPKTGAMFNANDYIFKRSRFLISEGALEPFLKAKSHSFPIPDSKIVVILHQDHKVYFSEKSDTYSGFVLEPALHRDTRTYIQGYFREHYGLEISVRPVHKKWISKHGEPYILVNAQIQTGSHLFSQHTKEKAKIYLEKMQSI